MKIGNKNKNKNQNNNNKLTKKIRNNNAEISNKQKSKFTDNNSKNLLYKKNNKVIIKESEIKNNDKKINPLNDNTSTSKILNRSLYSNNIINTKINILKINKVSSKDKDLNDEEMNSLEYDKACEIDKRTFFQFYWSLIKKKQIILFTFMPINDFNLFYMKICLFIFSFALSISVNGLFFTDETMHKIYKDKGILIFSINYLKLFIH
jgi:hypothetical protein